METEQKNIGLFKKAPLDKERSWIIAGWILFFATVLVLPSVFLAPNMFDNRGIVWIFVLAQFGIILFEALVIKKSLTDKSRNISATWKRTFAVSFIANTIKTIIGLGFLSLFWLIPDFIYLWAYLGFFMAIIFTFINFRLSVWVELSIAKFFYGNFAEIEIKKAVRKANIVSYAFLVILLVVCAIPKYIKFGIENSKAIESMAWVPAGDILLAPERCQIFACPNPEVDEASGTIKCNGKKVAQVSCDSGCKISSVNVLPSYLGLGTVGFDVWCNCSCSKSGLSCCLNNGDDGCWQGNCSQGQTFELYSCDQNCKPIGECIKSKMLSDGACVKEGDLTITKGDPQMNNGVAISKNHCCVNLKSKFLPGLVSQSEYAGKENSLNSLRNFDNGGNISLCVNPKNIGKLQCKKPTDGKAGWYYSVTGDLVFEDGSCMEN